MRIAGLVVGALVACSAQELVAQGLGPNGATARCRDGKFSTSKSETSACSTHGGMETWYGVATQTGPTSAAKKPDVFARLEELLSQEPSNSVIRADPDGSVIERANDSTRVAAYSYFTDFLDKEHGESGCRRQSNHCVVCTIPGHRIYCTNVDKFLPLPAF